MDELIERLRTLQDHYSTSGSLGALNSHIFAEAANEIERQQRQMTNTTQCENTDREIWRGPDEGSGSYYADSVHITKDGGLGINVGGTVIVKPLRDWHGLAAAAAATETALLQLCINHGFATGHGDTAADIIREIDGQIPMSR